MRKGTLSESDLRRLGRRLDDELKLPVVTPPQILDLLKQLDEKTAAPRAA